MRTARALTVSHSMLCAGGGVYLVLGEGVWSRGVWSRGVYGLGGVYGSRGVSGPRGCLILGGLIQGGGSGCVWVWWVSGPGGVWSQRGWCLVLGGLIQRGCLAGGSDPGRGARLGGGVWFQGVSASVHAGIPPPGTRHPPPREQNSWHTPMKILPWPNFVAAGN